jgi:hypothetical protein
MRLLLCALLLTGCATTPEVSFQLGERRTSLNSDHVPAVVIELRTYFGPHAFCSWVHNSEPQNGRPFNDREEITFDQPGCGAKWGGKPWD